MSSEPLRVVDLFCGAGGLSFACAQACEEQNREVELAAVNHWDVAVDTHEKNHPWADHYRAGVEELTPREVFPDGEIDLLIAAPECTHFSSARGGRPVNPQKRMSPFHIFDWVAQLRPKSVLVENVPDFRQWGPVIDGQPTRNSQFFEAWKNTLGEDGLGYSVSVRELTAADYGDPTSRERMFVIARRDDHPIWPEPTHSEDGREGTKPWRTAAEIIDWSDLGMSIWTRDEEHPRVHTPPAEKTMCRIAEGIRRHCHEALQPFAEALDGMQRADFDRLREHVVAAADAAREASSREEPFLVEGPALDSEASPSTAMLLGQHGGSIARDVEERPVPTVATSGAITLFSPETFILPRDGVRGDIHSNATYAADDRPAHTVTASNHDGHLVSPFLIKYYGNSDSQPVDEPLATVTTKDRFALVVPEHYPWGLDVGFRMLQPRELAAAQGFPASYEFAGGTKKAVVKQIGNAVPVNLGTALCRQLIEHGSPTLSSFSDVAEADSEAAGAVTDGGESASGD